MYLENSHLVTKYYEITVDSMFLSSKRLESILTYILLNLKTPPWSKGRKGIKYTWLREHSRFAHKSVVPLAASHSDFLDTVLSMRNSVHNVVSSN